MSHLISMVAISVKAVVVDDAVAYVAASR